MAYLSDVALLAVDWGVLLFLRWSYIASCAADFADSWTRPTGYVPVHIASIVGMRVGVYTLVGPFRNDFAGSYCLPKYYRGLCVAVALIPLMLFLAGIGRRLLQLRVAGMVAEINLARTLDGIQDALRRALDDPSLENMNDM